MKQPHEMRPGNRYARQGQARRTLGDLIASKSALVAICQRCKHRRLLYAPVLASRLGENFLVVNLPQHLRCAECNRHGAAKVYESSAEPHRDSSSSHVVRFSPTRKYQGGSDLHPKLSMFRASRVLS
jgi:hypothetical protein